MKRLGRLVFMTGKEFDFMLCRSSDNDDATYRAGFNAGKFHASGGYGKALKATRAKLQETEALLSATASQRFDMQRLLEKWQPMVEALETTPGQFTEIP